MRIFKKFGLMQKVLLPLLAVCFGCAVGLSVLSFQFWRSAAEYERFLDTDVIGAYNLVHARADLRHASGIVSNLLYSADTADSKDSLLKARKDVAQIFGDCLMTIPDRKGEIGEIAKAADDLLGKYLEAVENARTGYVSSAKAQMVELGPKAEAIDDKLDKMADTLQQHVDETRIALTTSIWMTIVATCAATGVSMVAVFLIAVMANRRWVIAPLHALKARMEGLAAGDTQSAVQETNRTDEIGAMAKAVAVFCDKEIERLTLENSSEEARASREADRNAREQERRMQQESLTFAIENLGDALSRLAAGDLVHRIEHPFAGELEALRRNFNASADSLHKTLRAVGSNASAIAEAAAEVRTATNELSTRTTSQAASVEETAAAIEQITRTVSDATLRAEDAGRLVEQTRAGAVRSGEIVRKAVEAIYNIDKSSGEIANIIGVIDEIAFQTNLLALNAGVEAARAGDAGRGFAVVAQEVRELAQRSAKAAKEIKTLIMNSSSQVKSGVELVDATGEALRVMVEEIHEINRHVSAVVSAAHEQSVALKEINQSVITIDQNTQHNASMVELTTSTSMGLASEASQLDNLLRQFNLGLETEPVYAAPLSEPEPPRRKVAGQKSQWMEF